MKKVMITGISGGQGRLIAKRLAVPRSRVRVARGSRSRRKLVRVEGIEPARVRRALGRAEPNPR